MCTARGGACAPWVARFKRGTDRCKYLVLLGGCRADAAWRAAGGPHKAREQAAASVAAPTAPAEAHCYTLRGVPHSIVPGPAASFSKLVGGARARAHAAAATTSTATARPRHRA